MRSKKDSKKVQITFSKEQLDNIRKHKGVFGSDDSEIIRNIVINWLYNNGGNKNDN